MADYQLIEEMGWRSILRRADDAVIPLDPANRDYQEYLAWIAEGNTPDPAPLPATEQ
jgi:hypothetical protein